MKGNLSIKTVQYARNGLTYSNFKAWFDTNRPSGIAVDIDKDIIFKNNTIYAPDTVTFVPHVINTLVINGRKARGELPIGVYFDNNTAKYRAEMSFFG